MQESMMYAFLLAVLTLVAAFCCYALGQPVWALAMVAAGTGLTRLFLKRK